MGGGAYLLTQLGNRSTFKDIDVLLEDIPDPSGSPLYLPFQQAMRAVAARHGLAANWINDVIGDALRTYGPTPTRTPWRVYGPLEVLVPERAYILILALTLLAHRTQDEADIHTLCQELWIGTRAEPIRAVYLVFSSGEAGLSFLCVEGGAHLVTHLHLKREVQHIWPCQ